MSFRTFFDFTLGFNRTLYFKSGTFDRVHKQVNETERRLGIRREYYMGSCRWSNWPKLVSDETSDEEYCRAVEKHNSMVRCFYQECCGAGKRKTKAKPEAITPYMAQNLFIGLRQLNVRPERWTYEYYQSRMEAMYQAMRGNETEGIIFDSKPLTIKQARDVIILFSSYLDTHDIRLDVCRGHDQLTNSYSEGYYWCQKCGAVDYDDLPGDFSTGGNEYCNKCKKKYEKW